MTSFEPSKYMNSPCSICPFCGEDDGELCEHDLIMRDISPLLMMDFHPFKTILFILKRMIGLKPNWVDIR